ncbi:MAG: PIN domain-containing protein [Cytophagaceae bacterium]|jgi:predicted nucleic acid-binding protein|nr:PIN domain-containing protein [Cytophagaceae bacterium]
MNQICTYPDDKKQIRRKGGLQFCGCLRSGKHAIAKWQKIATVDVDVSETIVNKGKDIMLKGIKKKDALHIACAIEAKCTCFLTTDKKLLRTTFNEITVTSPIDFIKILKI